jgi:esterase/lipase
LPTGRRLEFEMNSPKKPKKYKQKINNLMHLFDNTKIEEVERGSEKKLSDEIEKVEEDLREEMESFRNIRDLKNNSKSVSDKRKKEPSVPSAYLSNSSM